MNLKQFNWKGSIIKSIVYRLITLALGTITAYIFLGSIALATGTALFIEAVQGVNYFVFELIWSTFERRRLEKKFEEKYKERKVNLEIEFSSIKEIAYDLSNVDTFVPKIYLSTLNFFNHLLKNDELEEIHDEIQGYKEHFVQVHSARKMFF
jgi:uncharacterized membrane protein